MYRATERGWKGGTITPGPLDFKGPIGFRKGDGFSGRCKGDHKLEGAHQNDTEKLVCEAVKPFFFWRSHHFSDQTAAFFPSILDFLDFTKSDIRHF